MPYAVVLFFDESAELAVGAVGRRLIEADLRPTIGARPHVSLGACQDLDVPGFRPLLAAFAARCDVLDFQLASVATFPTKEGVVFLGPVVTAGLLSLHSDFHRLFAEHAILPNSLFTPDRWIPHVTVAIDLPSARVLAAINLCLEADLPIVGRYERIGLVRFPPPEELIVFPIGQGKVSAT